MFGKKANEALKNKFLFDLRNVAKEQGSLGKEGAVDSAMGRVEKGGLSPIFALLGITREDIEKCFKEEEEGKDTCIEKR